MNFIPNKGFKALLSVVLGFSLCLQPFTVQAWNPNPYNHGYIPTAPAPAVINEKASSKTSWWSYCESAAPYISLFSSFAPKPIQPILEIAPLLPIPVKGIVKISKNPKSLLSNNALRIVGLTCAHGLAYFGTNWLNSKLNKSFNESETKLKTGLFYGLTGLLGHLFAKGLEKQFYPKLQKLSYKPNGKPKSESQLSDEDKKEKENLQLERSWYSNTIRSTTGLLYSNY